MKRKKSLSDTNLLLLITIVVFFVMYISAILFLKQGFLKPQGFFNILNENAYLIILSCGMSLVMITGGIDISVGTLTALICMSSAVLLDMKGGNVVEAILLSLCIGLAFGIVQGFLIAYLEIQPFIVTLAGLVFAKGMTTIVNATQFNVENEEFKALKATRIIIPGMGGVISPEFEVFPKPYEGMFDHNGMTVILSRGLGNSVAPVRINNYPELVVVKLH